MTELSPIEQRWGGRLEPHSPRPVQCPGQGVHRDGAGACFVVWAPRVAAIELVLQDDAGEQATFALHPMTADATGRFADVPACYAREHWTLTLPSIREGQRYGYRLAHDSPTSFGPVRPDPVSRHQPDGVHRLSAVDFGEAWEAGGGWQHDFAGVPLRDLVLYELHVGTFTPEGTFAAAIERLPDLVELGVTALEVMPVAQFPGDRGWGYDGVHPFAVQNTYGGPEGFRRFIDAAHGLGLGVLLDVVYNHFGPEGNYLAEFGPYTTGRYQTPWGEGLNFDGRGSDAVRQFVLDNVRHWIGTFRLDGLRLDAIQTIIDVSASPILAEIAAVAEEVAGNRPVHIIGETDQNDARLVTPRRDDEQMTFGIGLAACWNDDLHHAVHALVTGERDIFYADFLPPYTTPPRALARVFAGVFDRDGRYCDFRGHSAGRPVDEALPLRVSPAQFVGYIQNHDQAGNRAYGERLHELCSPEAYRCCVALLLLSEQTPLLFQGEEYAEPARFPFFCDFEDAALNENVRRGRAEAYWPDATEWTDDMPDPPRRRTFERARLTWDWSKEPQAGTRQLYRTLLAFRRRWLAERQTSVTLHENETLVVERGPLAAAFNLTTERRPNPLAGDAATIGSTACGSTDAAALAAWEVRWAAVQ